MLKKVKIDDAITKKRFSGLFSVFFVIKKLRFQENLCEKTSVPDEKAGFFLRFCGNAC